MLSRDDSQVSLWGRPRLAPFDFGTYLGNTQLMGEFSLFHWLIVLFVLGLFWVLPLFFAYRHGKAVGERDGYIKGLKEGQGKG